MSRFETVREVENRSYRSSDRVHWPYPSLPASYAPRSLHDCSALRVVLLRFCYSREKCSKPNVALESVPARAPVSGVLVHPASSLSLSRLRFKTPWRARRSCRSWVRIGSVCVLALIPHTSDPNRNEETTVFCRVSQSEEVEGLVISDE